MGLTFFYTNNFPCISVHNCCLLASLSTVATNIDRCPLPTLPLPYLQLDLIKINDNSKRNLEQELNGYKLDAQKQAKQIWALEREREAYGAQVSTYLPARLTDWFLPLFSVKLPQLQQCTWPLIV